jgi:hypothetical protein
MCLLLKLLRRGSHSPTRSLTTTSPPLSGTFLSLLSSLLLSLSPRLHVDLFFLLRHRIQQHRTETEMSLGMHSAETASVGRLVCPHQHLQRRYALGAIAELSQQQSALVSRAVVCWPELQQELDGVKGTIQITC